MPYVIKLGKRSFDLKSITVEPVLFFYLLCGFAQHVTSQALVYDKVCRNYFNSSICEHLHNHSYKAEETVVQKHASTWLLYVNIAQGIPSFFVVGLFLGPFADRVGRKVPLIVALCGTILKIVVDILVSVYMDWPLWTLLVGPAINGLFGAHLAVEMGAFSYIANVSKQTNRTVRMAIVHSVSLASVTVGSLISGVLLDKMGYVFVFSFLCGLLTVTLVYALVWLENIVPERADKKEDEGGLCYTLFVSAVKDVCVCVYRKRKHVDFLNLAILIASFVVVQLLTVGEMDILLIFTRHAPFDWNQTMFGYFRALDMFLRGLAVITVLPVLKRRLGTRDITLLITGLISKTLGFVVIGVGRTTAVLFVGAAVNALEGFIQTSIRAMCSLRVADDEQGKVFGLIAILQSLGQIVAAILFNSVYKATLDLYSGFCFIMSAGICVALLGMSVCLQCRLKREDSSPSQMQQVYIVSFTKHEADTGEKTKDQ